MQYISSDTSVWIDFSVIHHLPLPFRLPYTYIMSTDAIDDELLSPPGLGAQLKAYGLMPVEMTFEEFLLAQEYRGCYPRLSTYDCIALAIAKNRNIILLTGDGALRKAAAQNGVSVKGTLGIIDELWTDGLIDDKEYRDCLIQLKEHNHGVIRLPDAEIEKRLKNL